MERRYQSTLAVAGFSLDIAPAEVVCLLGPSGCGKTTLLRLAAGIERPTSGRVLINDSEVAGPARFVAPEKRQRRPDVSRFRAFPALEHTRQRCLRPQVASQGGCPPRGAAALARVGLERYAQAYPTSSPAASSSAWALARAIVPRPAVMLMDEPFSGLDVQLRERLQETLALLRETRATCLIVTHAPAEAIRLGASP